MEEPTSGEDRMTVTIMRLAVSTELMVQAVEGLVRKDETSDRDAVLLGVLAHLSRQQQTTLEVLAGFKYPIEVSVARTDPPTDEKPN